VISPSRQGEVWRVETVGGRSVPVLIVDGTAVAARSAMITVAQIREPYELPNNLLLLAVPITDPVKGVISIADIQVYRRSRFAEPLGDIDCETMAAVRSALAARFDLDVQT
jgi:mRNA-degrading endonuclease toxin of MazEF toxin-antitoxin module